MGAIARRALILGASVLAVELAASARADEAPGDEVVIGAAEAPVTLVEYGSAMCSHCRAFEEACWSVLKSEYIDAGRVRFVFREALAPVSPDGSGAIEAITLAMYQVSRCENASPEQYFTRLSAFFERQPEIFRAGSMNAVLEIVVAIGAESGLTREHVMGCIRDPAGEARIGRLGDAFTRDAAAARIPPERVGTPMFFLDGQRLETSAMMSPEGLRQLLNAAIAAKS
jgi:hypothetical protein